MPFAVYGGICFKCNGAGKFYTKRGRVAAAFLQRLRERTLAEIKPGMLIYYQGFSAGSFSVPSKFYAVQSIGELKPTGRSKSGDGPWVQNYGHDIVCDGMTMGTQADTLHRVGQTGLGKRETLRLALDFQDVLTKTGTVRKGATFPTAEEVLATMDTSGWLVQNPAPEAAQK